MADPADVAQDAAQALAAPDEQPVILPLPTLLAEIAAALRHPREAPWLRGRATLRAEWSATSATIGSGLRESIGDGLSRCEAALQVAGGALERAAAASEIEVVLAAARTPGALGAAWADFLEAASNPVAEPAGAIIARAQFEALQRAAGQDAEDLRKRLLRVLRDDALVIAQERVRIGRAAVTPEIAGLVGRSAGLAAQDRLDLAATLARLVAPTGRCVVWIAFRPAVIDGFRLPAGAVTFLDAAWVVPNAVAENGQEFPEREELRSLSAHLPDEDALADVVLARVDLGRRSPAGAVEDAVDAAAAIVEAAAIRDEGLAWAQYGWTVLLVDGGPRLWSTFVPEDEVRTWRNPERLRRVAADLNELAPRLGPALGVAPLPPDLRAAIRSAAETHDAHPANQILLYQRMLELVAAHAGLEDPWALASFIEGDWPLGCWRRDALNAVHRARDAALWPSTNGTTVDLADVYSPEGTSGGFTINLARAADRINDIDSLFEGWTRRRTHNALVAVDDSVVLDQTLRRYRRDARLLMQRYRRTRDALAHGNPVDRAVIATVVNFARFVARGALVEALEAHIEGRDLVTTLRQQRETRRTQERAVRDGASMRSQWQG